MTVKRALHHEPQQIREAPALLEQWTGENPLQLFPNRVPFRFPESTPRWNENADRSTAQSAYDYPWDRIIAPANRNAPAFGRESRPWIGHRTRCPRTR